MKRDYFNCGNCGDKVMYEDVNDNPYKDGRTKICDDCYRRLFQIDCPLCEEYFSSKTPKPSKYYFVVMPVDVEAAGLPSGIYRCKAYPVWTSDIISVTIQSHNVEIVKPLDKIILHQEGVHTDQICPDCFKKYTNDQWLAMNYKLRLLQALYRDITEGYPKVTKEFKGDMKYVAGIAKIMVVPLKNRIKRLYSRIYNFERSL